MQLAEPLNLPKIEMFLCRENPAVWMFDPFLLLMKKNCCHGPWEREIHRGKAVLRSLFDERGAVTQLPTLSCVSEAWCGWHCGIREQCMWDVWARTLEPVDHAGSLISTFLEDRFLCHAAPYCTLNRGTWWAGGDVHGEGAGGGQGVPLGKFMSLCLILLIVTFFSP